jgi:phospholipid/cholesterol/gamma-HCH transport system substrate-binding protein
MQKQAPTFGRIAVMALFALSCFGLLLFLWLSFGGSVPLRPQGYRVQVAFPEATQLGEYADVRMAGVSVGKVRKKKLDPDGNRTIAIIEFDGRAAPLRSDAKAILRQKTLLGETYVELTPGTKGAKPVPEGGKLQNGQVSDTVELDEIFRAFDPATRQSFRDWQQALSKSINGRGPDLNDALGNLPAFAADATDVLEVLDGQEAATQRLVRNTGVVFDALSENQQALRGLITNSDAVFSATQQQQEALADTFKVFPTFLDESRSTMRRLESFSTNARPVIRDLRPVTRDLKPTLRDVRRFAPDLRTTFRNLDPLITVSKQGLPALRDTLKGTGPVLEQLTPFLGQLNPILEWLEHNQQLTADFITNGAGGLVDTTPLTPEAYAGGELGHYLRQIGPAGAESAAMYRERPAGNRGNSYLSGTQLTGPPRAQYNMPPSTNCDNSARGEFKRTEADGETDPPTGGPGASCYRETLPGAAGPGQIPQINAKDYLTATPPTAQAKK